MLNLKRFILDLLFPPRCVGCRQTGTWLCAQCLTQIAPLPTPRCALCGGTVRDNSTGRCAECRANPLQIDGIRSATDFAGVMRTAIHRFKYSRLQALASPLGEILANYLAQTPLSFDVIIPVPLHPSRQRERGYNQAELLAQELGTHTQHLVWTDVMQRIKKTRPQVGLNAMERRQNVAAAFVCTTARIAGQRVLLIDDVCTTGATLEACSLALRAHGVASVWGLTLARPGNHTLADA